MTRSITQLIIEQALRKAPLFAILSGNCSEIEVSEHEMCLQIVQKRKLEGKLKVESSGIFNWLLEGDDTVAAGTTYLKAKNISPENNSGKLMKRD